MKAKEWVEKFNATTEHADLLKEFGVELAQLVENRTRTSTTETKYPAADGAVREQQTKWMSICNKVPVLNKVVFQTIVDAAVPEFQLWKVAFEKKKVEKKKTDDVKDYRNKRK